jgi:hypothetical protein
MVKPYMPNLDKTNFGRIQCEENKEKIRSKSKQDGLVITLIGPSRFLPHVCIFMLLTNSSLLMMKLIWAADNLSRSRA